MKGKEKDVFVEESIFIGSALKWTLFSVIIGITVGTITSLFIKLIGIGSRYTARWHYYYLLLPAGLFLSSYIINKFAPDAKGHGTEKAIEAVNEKSGNMDIKVVPVKLITTFITIIFGGSVGLEGPATQIGASISSFLAQKLKMDEMDKRRLVVCGISAGFVSVFGAPIGAAIFAAEVLYIGKISYLSLLPSLVASFASYYTSLYFGVKPLNYVIKVVPSDKIITFINMVVFGVLIGLLAKLFIKLTNFIEGSFKKIKMYSPLKGIIGGLIILVFVFLFKSTAFLGIGDKVIDGAIAGEKINKLSFLLKMFSTSMTLGCGGSGGILTPMLFIGSTFGNAWGSLINGNIQFYAAVGMVAFLSACSNTPIAAIIVSLELFGGKVGVFAAIACGISYLVVGHDSIYPTQLFMLSKSPTILYDTNCEVRKVKNTGLKIKYSFERKAFNSLNYNKHKK